MKDEIKQLAEMTGSTPEQVWCLLVMCANMIYADLLRDGATEDDIEEDIVRVVQAYIPAVVRKYREMSIRAHMNPDELCRAVLAHIRGGECAAPDKALDGA